jgi:hypothetical protein
MKWVEAGLCVNLKSVNQTRHLWVVLTEPYGEPPRVALANLTSHKDGIDETVVLEAGEHSFIRRKTVVNYAAAQIVSATKLEQLIEADLTIPHRELCSDELLEKIRQGVFDSPFASPKFQKYCRERLEID